MSWDVLVMKFGGPPPPDIARWDDDPPLLPLGMADEVRARVTATLPGVDWTDPTWGMYGGDGFSFELSIDRDGPVNTFMVHVRGGGDPIADLMRFAVPNGWVLLDCSTSDFLDPANPSRAGWRGFQQYRDQVLKRPPEGDAP